MIFKKTFLIYWGKEILLPSDLRGLQKPQCLQCQCALVYLQIGFVYWFDFFGDIPPFLSPGNPTSWSKGCSSSLGRSPLALTRFILRFFRTYWLKPVWWRGIWHPLSWNEENLLLLKYFLVYSAASLGTFPSTCRSEAQFIESFFFSFF